jgi:lipopolysaccharide export system protein LptA
MTLAAASTHPSFPARLTAAAALLLLLACPARRLAAADAPAAELPPTIITSDSGEAQSTDTETTSHFNGHVVVTGNDIRIDCDALEVISARSGDKSDTIGTQNSFKYILATGHVHIRQGDREAACARAEVLPLENKITLTGQPVVTDRGNGTTYTGEPLILYRNERRVTGEHVHITAPPIKDLGFDKNEPPPAPPKQP